MNPRRLAVPLASAAAIVVWALIADPYRLRLLTLAGIMAIAAIGYHLILGRLGVLSLAQGAFLGLGAYGAGVLSHHLGLGFPLTLIAAIALTMLLAAIVAVPVLRLDSHYFALATLGLAQVALIGAINWESLTGGANGLAGIQPVARGSAAALLVWGMVALAALIAVVLTRGLRGGAMMLAREAPLAAGAVGIDVGALRFLAFTCGAGLAGAAGALQAHTLGVVSPETLEIGVMVAILSMTVIGGRERIAGAILGAVMLTHLPELFRGAERYALMIYGAALLATILIAPDGLMGRLQAARARLWPVPRPQPPAPIVWAPRARPVAGTVLAIDMVAKRYGGVQALDGVSLTLARGEILGLIGPNGSGKTTLINLVTGLARPDSGRVSLAGKRLPASAAAIARAGLARGFQTPQIAAGLSVLDHVALARPRRDANARGEAMALLVRLALDVRAMDDAAALSPPERRRLELARALATEPIAIALDEPAAGLAADETRVLAAELTAIARRGIALLVVDHDVGFLAGFADRLACLEAGRLIGLGRPAEVTADPRVIAAYLGKRARRP